jgi:DNA polymerase III subunit gamma/tau
VEAKLTHVADAVEHSEVTEAGAEIIFAAPKMYQLFLKGPEFEAAVRTVAGRAVRITLKVGEAAAAAPALKAPVNTAVKDEASERAMAHPEVKRFQELFPESQVRAVRNLKENEQ